MKFREPEALKDLAAFLYMVFFFFILPEVIS